MKKRPDETEEEAYNRRSRTCYYCPREDANAAESIEHEKEHEKPRSGNPEPNPKPVYSEDEAGGASVPLE
jgi:hypothetical protein